MSGSEELGTDLDPALLAEASFAPNNLESRDLLAPELFPNEPAKCAKFRLAWDLLQQWFEQGVL